MNGYSVSIKEINRELSAKERIKFKDTGDAAKLDEVTQFDGDVILKPDMYGVLAIHNEMSENKDYEVYVIVDTTGKKYATSSRAFWDSFTSIANEMAGETEEWAIRIYRMPSKNYKGKEFITCSIE